MFLYPLFFFQQGCTSVSACEWALAVCEQFGGNAGGSDVVANGVSNATNVTDVSEILNWAEKFAFGKIKYVN